MKTTTVIALLALFLFTPELSAQDRSDLCSSTYTIKLMRGTLVDGNNRKSYAGRSTYHFRDGYTFEANRAITQRGRDRVWLKFPFHDKYVGEVTGIRLTYTLKEKRQKAKHTKSYIKNVRILAVDGRRFPVRFDHHIKLKEGNRITKVLQDEPFRDSRKKELAFSFVLNNGDALTIHKAEILFDCD